MPDIDIAEKLLHAELDQYDAGLLGGNPDCSVDWWHDYIRDELNRAHEFYDDQARALIADLTAVFEMLRAERDAARAQALEEAACAAEGYGGRILTVSACEARSHIAARIRALKVTP